MSASAPSAKALADAKVKRQKQILAVGSVILLALLGYQLPKLLGGGGESSGSAQPAVTSPVTGATTPASPLASASGTLPDTDRVVIEPMSGQLLSFGLFKSKDPFVQQLSTVAAGLPSIPATPAPQTATSAGFGATTTTSVPHTPPVRTAPNGGLTPVTTTTPGSTVPFPSTTTTPLTPSPVPTTPVVTPSTTPATTTTTPAAAPTSVAISTNGACENVAVDGTFPGNEDIFRVVSIARDGKSAKIAVVGGAYDSGQGSATLKLSERLTLVNTADGTRYVLLLKSRCDVETQPVTATTTTSTVAPPATTTTSTVAPPATTTTATTPIVTDAFDTTTPTG